MTPKYLSFENLTKWELIKWWEVIRCEEIQKQLQLSMHKFDHKYYGFEKVVKN